MKERVLLISLGSIGKRHLRNTRELLPDAEIAILRLHNKSELSVPCGANFVFRELSEAQHFGPHAVIISSPASEHISNLLSFLSSDCHVFVEKPLAHNTEQISQLATVIERNPNNFSMVGYVLRFQPLFHKIKEIIKQQSIGEIYYSNIEVGQFLPDWRPNSDYRDGVSGQKALGGGVLLELSHEIDYATWVFGDPSGINCDYDKLSSLEIDVEDYAHIYFDYSSTHPKKVSIQLDFLQRTPSMSFKIVGSEGTIYADPIKDTISISKPNTEDELITCHRMSDPNEMYLRQFDFFFHKSFSSSYQPRFQETSSINDNDFVSLERGMKILKLIEVMRSSANSNTRKPVEAI